MPQPFNVNWPLWINASVITYFSQACGTTVPLALLPEGWNLKSIPEGSDRLELRIEGPVFEEMTQGVWKVKCTISTLIIIAPDPTNAYKTDIIRGLVGSLFITRIPLFKTDQTRFCCLIRRDNITTQPYGFVESTQSMIYSTVEADYFMIIS